MSDYYSQCLGKTRHIARYDAEQEQARVNRRKKAKVRVYLCKFCKGYHVGRFGEELNKKQGGSGWQKFIY